MSLLRRLRREPEHGPVDEVRSAWPVPGWSFPAAPTASGQVVTPDNALRSAAVAACVRVIKTEVAQLPVDVVRVVGRRRQVVNPPPMVVRRPSQRVTRRGWVAQMLDAQITAGNGYGLVVARDPRTLWPTQVESVAPSDVRWRKVDGQAVPWVGEDRHDVYPFGDLVHVPATAYLRAGSPVAESPVELAKQAIGTALAAEDFGARFFGDGYHPTVVAKSASQLTKTQADDIKAAINRMRGDREPGVFGSGIELERWQVDPKDSQFIDLMRFEVEQACRFFGVPPSMVYAAISGQSVTYANVSQADLQFLKHSLGIWLSDLEDAWSSMLAAPQVVKFNVDALLRMDAPTRHALYKTRLDSRTMTVNEVRALEDEEPLGPEFDAPGIPGAAGGATPFDTPGGASDGS